MTDSRSTALVASLVGGYLLGRGGKGQAALGVAAYLASRKLLDSTAQQDSADQDRESTSPLRRLGKRASGELLTAGFSALTSTVNRRLETVAETLEGRSQALSGSPDTDTPEAPEASGGDEAPAKGSPSSKEEGQASEDSEGTEDSQEAPEDSAGAEGAENSERSAEAPPRTSRRTGGRDTSTPATPKTPATPASPGTGERGGSTQPPAQKPTERAGREGTRRASSSPSRSRRSSTER